MALPEDPGVVATLTGAIEAAATVLEAMTRSSFGRADHVDVFCRPARGGLVPSGLVALELSTGLIQPDTLVVVGSSTIEGLSTGYAVPVSLVAPDLGHVFISPEPGVMFYQVTYTAGFETGADGCLVGVPGWLAEAATFQSILSLSAMQVGDGKPGLSEAYSYLGASLSALVDAHDRRRAHYLRPIA